ncbi:MAG: NAD-dependent epimerase/dehydratase family protein [Acetobacteraceae bacterium]|nr:NAD-dependent epimerase/dehydratase family protein [Acetobacteraceae bacterium]MBV8590772.1 NAD-dependent epimerase/dehydratase family protein [Acetobacteraceae bacterium]
MLVTGGAGFIGSNLADRLASLGHHVLVYDSLCRPGVETNVAWLRRRHPQRVALVRADIRDTHSLNAAVARSCAVFHLAAQVAVTTSMLAPEDDFEINVGATLRLLEALRRLRRPVPLIFASTNKVYGDLAGLKLREEGGSYQPRDPVLRSRGISESQAISFHTPYGCSKGAADQYVLDYARSFGLPATVLRMSCIYGARQHGTEDQGWVAHFLLRAMAGEPITIYGNGRQVRDILYIDDTVDAYVAAWQRIGAVAGRVFNLGGGPENAVSLVQVVACIEGVLGEQLDLRFTDWRPADQRWFVSDPRQIRAALELDPPIPWRKGLALLADFYAASMPRPRVASAR